MGWVEWARKPDIHSIWVKKQNAHEPDPDPSILILENKNDPRYAYYFTHAIQFLAKDNLLNEKTVLKHISDIGIATHTTEE